MLMVSLNKVTFDQKRFRLWNGFWKKENWWVTSNLFNFFIIFI